MINFKSHRFRAGENEAVNVRIGNEFVARGAARPGDEVKYARRQAGVAERFVKTNAGVGRVAGRLENDGVTGHQRARGHAGAQREREVERGDDGPHAVGFEHAACVLGAGAAHRQFIAAVFFHLLAVIENQVNGFGDFGDGFETILANFQCEDCSEIELSLCHQISGSAKDFYSRSPAEIGAWFERFAALGPHFAIHDVTVAGPPWNTQKVAALDRQLAAPPSEMDLSAP